MNDNIRTCSLHTGDIIYIKNTNPYYVPYKIGEYYWIYSQKFRILHIDKEHHTWYQIFKKPKILGYTLLVI